MPNKVASAASKGSTRTRMEQLIAEMDKIISREKSSDYGVKVAKKSKKK